MKPEAQRIAIAEACGWIPSKVGPYWNNPSRMETRDELPDYLNDLNAMHEAEKAIPMEMQGDYIDWFFHNLEPMENQGPSPSEEGDIMCVGLWQIAHATAAHRAEAFLRTLGKWVADDHPTR